MLHDFCFQINLEFWLSMFGLDPSVGAAATWRFTKPWTSLILAWVPSLTLHWNPNRESELSKAICHTHGVPCTASSFHEFWLCNHNQRIETEDPHNAQPYCPRRNLQESVTAYCRGSPDLMPKNPQPHLTPPHPWKIRTNQGNITLPPFFGGEQHTDAVSCFPLAFPVFILIKQRKRNSPD